MKVLRKSLFMWIPLMGIIANPSRAATDSKNAKPTEPTTTSTIKKLCPTPNTPISVFTWQPDGSSQTNATYTLDTSSYTCFLDSFVAAYKPQTTMNKFTLMYSMPIKGGYGKRQYGIISSIEDVKQVKTVNSSHIDYIPEGNWQMPNCTPPSTEGTLPPWSVQLEYWDSKGINETSCGDPILLDATCETGTPDCYEILQIAAKTSCGKSVSYLYHPYTPTTGYGMQCYTDINNTSDLLKALKEGHHTFLIVY